MENLIDYTHQRIDRGWLINIDSHQAIDQINKYYLQYQQEKTSHTIIHTTDTLTFIAQFIASVSLNIPVFLTSPQWNETENSQVEEIINSANIDLYQGCIMIPTGGTSGKIKFAIHTWLTLSNAVRGFQEFYQVEKINTYCVLPLYHVSGLMQIMRSLLTGGKILITNWKDINYQEISSIDLKTFFLSLVPTQLRQITERNLQWLKQFNTILLGGAPADLDLLKQCQFHQIPIALTYGMTETAGQITSLHPHEFLTGNINSGQVLPHAVIIIEPENEQHLIGLISINATSQMLGYFPQISTTQLPIKTDDIGKLEDGKYLHILGRNSYKIITGGEKIFPAEVESVILSTGLVKDVYVFGTPDHQWGEVVTAVYVPCNDSISNSQIAEKIRLKISHYKVPKKWFSIKEIPRNLQGKVNLQDLDNIISNMPETNETIL